MNAIWKYTLILGTQTIAMPAGAALLTAQLQDNLVTVWAEVESDNDMEERTLAVVGTGHRLPGHPRKYVATLQQGPFVWHVYEVVR